MFDFFFQLKAVANGAEFTLKMHQMQPSEAIIFKMFWGRSPPGSFCLLLQSILTHWLPRLTPVHYNENTKGCFEKLQSKGLVKRKAG